MRLLRAIARIDHWPMDLERERYEYEGVRVVYYTKGKSAE